MTERTGAPWLNYALGLLCVGAILAAVLVVGPASSSTAATRRTAKAAEGIVQSTVSGSGNLEPASQLNLGFKTAGTVEHVYVKQGDYVTEGRLLATLDPVPAEVTLEQARATLQTAEAALAREEETDGEGKGSSAGSAGSPAKAAATSSSTPGSARSPSSGSGASPASGSSSGLESSSTGSTSTLSPATREANIASARAAVKSDRLTVRSDEEAVAGTRLYAPEGGTIVSLSGQVGEVVSATGTTKASAPSSSGSAGSGSGSGSSSGRSGASANGGASAGSGSGSGGSSSAFAVLSDLSSMKLVAALSESEIRYVKVGQIATVTVEALEGRKLAAHVREVATLSTSSSGVVSYDVTFGLDQMDPGLKPGMSATAEVIVKQEEGLSVPSSAISGGSVMVLRDGKDVRQAVTTGLAGNSSTIILSGLGADETVVLPQATSSGSSSLSSLLRSRLGGGGLGGGGGGAFLGGGGGGGGAVVFRGGG
ncbi:MAG TPA: biotin/lipoyl-binding protein [Solirubrobacteraceae bacterium]|jgi:multidrug efflux pump subunit AcrA (membrane-fusion protein)|nr:biotin/lipoyl-binding protein [Solirubrobacteraceae bacterium]